MASKLNPGQFDCYANAAPDEPMFVLLGRDRHAALLVNLWALMRAADGEDAAKIVEAFRCADDMVEYRARINPGLQAGVRAGIEALVRLADNVNCVVTVDQEPLQPLAMGNYRHRVQVRPKRGA